MCNFVLGMKPFLIYPPKKKFHMQKCDGLENIEEPSLALEVTLGSSTDINLEHNRIKIQNNVWGKFRYFESHLLGK